MVYYLFKKVKLTGQPWLWLFLCLIAILWLFQYHHNLHSLCTATLNQTSQGQIIPKAAMSNTQQMSVQLRSKILVSSLKKLQLRRYSHINRLTDNMLINFVVSQKKKKKSLLSRLFLEGKILYTVSMHTLGREWSYIICFWWFRFN